MSEQGGGEVNGRGHEREGKENISPYFSPPKLHEGKDVNLVLIDTVCASLFIKIILPSKKKGYESSLSLPIVPNNKTGRISYHEKEIQPVFLSYSLSSSQYQS